MKIKIVSMFSAAVVLSLLATFSLPGSALADDPICSSPNPNVIGDSLGQNVPGPVFTDTITINNAAIIQDFNLSISATHTYVGDLIFTLAHELTGNITSTVVYSRPKGIRPPPQEPACTGDNINIILDDEAQLAVQTDCSESVPPPSDAADDGTLAYIDGTGYRPFSSLTVFDGAPISGTWTISVTDNFKGDTGLLQQWCIIADSQPDLGISKSDGGLTPAPGQTIAYTLTYSNSGNQTATGVTITETLPANTSFNAAASSAGWSQVGGSTQYTFDAGTLTTNAQQNVTFAVTVDDPLPNGVSSVTNNVSIGDDGSNGSDANNTDNSDQLVTTVVAQPDLGISKSDGGLTPAPGQTIAYTLTYSNSGNQTATGVTITETLPANTSFNAAASSAGWSQVGGSTQYTFDAGTLTTNAQQNVTFAVTVDDPLPNGVSSVTNNVSIGDDGSNGSDANNTDNSDQLVTNIQADPDPDEYIFLPIVIKNN